MSELKKNLKIPEWFYEENKIITIGTYQATFIPEESSMDGLIYEITHIENKDDIIALLYIRDINNKEFGHYANFANLNPETEVNVEEAEHIIGEICKYFKLPFKSIRYSYHTKEEYPSMEPRIGNNIKIIKSKDGRISIEEEK